MLLLGVLVFMAVASMMLAGASQRWADTRQRDAEEELLYVGQQYRKAIESYYLRSPGRLRQFPLRLQDLVQDPRFPQPVRHIRRLWPDPVAPDKEWGLIMQSGAIVGVYSQSTGQPFRSANFDPALPQTFSKAKTYKDWRFVAGYGVVVAASGSQPAVLNGGTSTFNPGAPAGQIPRR